MIKVEKIYRFDFGLSMHQTGIYRTSEDKVK